METRFLIQSAPNPYAAFPHPNDATHKIWSRLVNWLQRYSSLKVWTTDDDDDDRRRTDDGPLVYYKLTLWAFGSGELKINTQTITYTKSSLNDEFTKIS